MLPHFLPFYSSKEEAIFACEAVVDAQYFLSPPDQPVRALDGISIAKSELKPPSLLFLRHMNLTQ